MNKLMCFLTGGHKYSDANIMAQTMPDDFNIVEIINPCIKCGTVSICYMNMRETNKTIDKILNASDKSYII